MEPTIPGYYFATVKKTQARTIVKVGVVMRRNGPSLGARIADGNMCYRCNLDKFEKWSERLVDSGPKENAPAEQVGEGAA